MIAALTHIAAFVAGLIVAWAVAGNCVRERQAQPDNIRPLTREDAARRVGC